MEKAHQRFRKGRPGGVTLIELIVVLAIIIILLSLLTPVVVKEFKIVQHMGGGIVLIAEGSAPITA